MQEANVTVSDSGFEAMGIKEPISLGREAGFGTLGRAITQRLVSLHSGNSIHGC